MFWDRERCPVLDGKPDLAEIIFLQNGWGLDEPPTLLFFPKVFIKIAKTDFGSVFAGKKFRYKGDKWDGKFGQRWPTEVMRGQILFWSEDWQLQVCNFVLRNSGLNNCKLQIRKMLIWHQVFKGHPNRFKWNGKGKSFTKTMRWKAEGLD